MVTVHGFWFKRFPVDVIWHYAIVKKRVERMSENFKGNSALFQPLNPKPMNLGTVTKSGIINMDKATFNKFRKLIYEKSGISMNESKDTLVSARVGKRVRSLGLNNHKEYLKYVEQDKTGNELVRLLDVISTNVTNFFRESHHFDIVKDLMKQWLAQGHRRFRFWSAGCSSGEEPYTLAMTLLECTGRQRTDIKILATDISTKILEKSAEGSYKKSRTEDIPAILRERYFDKNGRGETALYNVKQSLKKMIVFRRLNLSIVPFPMQGPMDVIFCRNVMIYFDNTVRKNLLNEFYRLIKPGGYLMVGHAESLTGIMGNFRSVRPSVYIKGE